MSKRGHEKAIFEAFLRVTPEFAGETLKEWSQPQEENEFPDIVCITTSGRRIGVELGEWLNEEEMCNAKGMERIQDSILSVVGKQGDNTTENIYFLCLLPKPKVRVKPADGALFRRELFRYIDAVDRRWPSEHLWHSPQGYRATSQELSSFPILQKYLASIQFIPRRRYEGWPPNGGFVKKTWPSGQDWILFRNRGGSYSEDTMLQPLLELIANKKERYGSIGTGLDSLHLVVYYNSAFIYNSPVETAQFEFKDAFEDAADRARQFIGDDPDPFNRIFLFVAINDGFVVAVV